MSVISTTITFADNDQVTSAKLNEIMSGASFTAGAIAGTTLSVVGGQLKVGTITSSEMGVDSVTTTALTALSVTTAKIADGAITTDKLANAGVTGGKIALATITLANVATSVFATKAVMQNKTAGYLVTPDMVKHSPGVAKAYGEFNIADATRTIKANSQNIASLTRIDATHTTVALDVNMDSANYIVLATFVGTDSSPENNAVSVYAKAAASFKLVHTSEGAGRALNFVVFGNLVS